jgi:putative ABC transport system permease protein
VIARLWNALTLRTPLGWRQLRHNPTRLLVALSGVVFADILIFMQLGVMGALYETSVTSVRKLDADIILMGPEARAIANLGTLPERRLYQALGVEGVRTGGALQVGSITLRNPAESKYATVLVLGVSPDFRAFLDPEIARQLPLLREADTALLDRKARSAVLPMVEALACGQTDVRSEMMGRTVALRGLYSLGASFSDDGSLIMSDQTFLRLFPRNTGSAPNAILLQVEAGADALAVAARLRAAMPASDTKVMTKDEYIQFVKNYMADGTPIGFVFTFGVIIGLVIGFGIVYQILSADVNDHLAEYATFKAMGYTHGYLLGVVFEEALLLAALGFVPGVLLSLGLYWLIGVGTELAVGMPASRPWFVLGLTFLICFVSGAVATRRLKAADPADVF